MMDKVFISHGYQGVVIAGGATSLIGDPGGKDIERPLQSLEVVETNVEAISRQAEKLFGGCYLVNNLDWTKNVTSWNFFETLVSIFL